MEGEAGALSGRARRLREAAEAARSRARRLAVQLDSMRWEGAAARALRTALDPDLAEVLGLALAAERAADALERLAAQLVVAAPGLRA